MDEANEAGADHHHSNGGKEDADDLGSGLCTSLSKELHDPSGEGEDKEDYNEICDEGDKRGEIAVIVHAKKDGGEGARADDEWDTDGNDPNVFNSAARGAPCLLGEEEVCNGNDEKDESSGNLEVIRGNTERIEDKFSQGEKSDGDGKGSEYGLTGNPCLVPFFHPECIGEIKGKGAYDINGYKNRDKGKEVVADHCLRNGARPQKRKVGRQPDCRERFQEVSSQEN